MSGMRAHRNANGFGDTFARRSFPQKLDMVRPGKCHQDAHAGSGATIKKPARRRMINPDNVQADLAHERKVDIDLLRSSEIISFRVRLEWTVGDSFNKKLSVTFEKEFRDWANSRVCLRCHVERSRDIPQWFLV